MSLEDYGLGRVEVLQWSIVLISGPALDAWLLSRRYGSRYQMPIHKDSEVQEEKTPVLIGLG